MMWSIRETVKTPQLFSCSHPPTKTPNRRRTSTQPFSFCCTLLPLARPDQSGDQYRSRMPFQLLDLSISSPTKGPYTPSYQALAQVPIPDGSSVRNGPSPIPSKARIANMHICLINCRFIVIPPLFSGSCLR